MCAAAAVFHFETAVGEGAVRLAPGLLEQLRDQVLDGYVAAPHGGVEIGFVLFGHAKASEIVIEHFRLVPCVHLLSPRFLLSPDEEKDFPGWLETLSSDKELQGTDIVGWGCSHHRCDLALLGREIDFHRRYFGRKNQVVMIVKPENMQAIMAGVFLPDAIGAIQGDRPAVQLRSAVLDSVLGHRGRSADGGAVAQHAPVPESAEEPVDSTAEPNRTARLRRVPFLAMAPPSKHSIVVDEPSAVESGLTLAEEPERAEAPERRRSLSVWVLGVAAGAAFLAAVLSIVFAMGWNAPGASASSPALSVGIRPQANNLVFSWQGNITRVMSAGIEVLDGDATAHFNVTSWFQPAGAFAFPHKTGNVQAVLTVLTPSGQKVVRSIAFLDGRTSPANTE